MSDLAGAAAWPEILEPPARSSRVIANHTLEYNVHNTYLVTQFLNHVSDIQTQFHMASSFFIFLDFLEGEKYELHQVLLQEGFSVRVFISKIRAPIALAYPDWQW